MAAMSTVIGPACLTVGSGLSIVRDPVKGRCLCTTRDLRAGELIFSEDALVYAEFQDDCEKTINADLLLRAFGKRVFGNLPELEEEFAAFESVQSMDTSRSWFQLLGMLILREDLSEENDLLGRRLRLALELTPGANLRECIETCKSFRELHKTVIPKRISTEEAGALLGLLNTNQVELEDLGGSGLFPNTAIIEHSCDFNCSYTTNGSVLYLTATKNVPSGTRLSIDYLNAYYSPTRLRREELHDSYGFWCDCQLCISPDSRRAFFAGPGICMCPDGTRGSKAFPLPASTTSRSHDNDEDEGDDEDEEEQFSLICSLCKANIKDAQFVAACQDREKQLLQSPPTSLSEVRSALSCNLLHRDHHIFFEALSDIAMREAELARSKKCGPDGQPQAQARAHYATAIAALQLCRAQLDATLPAVHHEKVILFDRLGQLSVAAGGMGELAQEAFRLAYASSCLASSAESPATLQIKALAEKTPKTLNELQQHYKH